MSTKTITLIAAGLTFAAIAYITYNKLSQLQYMEYNLFEEDIDDNDE
jgi:hypothetical protein